MPLQREPVILPDTTTKYIYSVLVFITVVALVSFQQDDIYLEMHTFFRPVLLIINSVTRCIIDKHCIALYLDKRPLGQK